MAERFRLDPGTYASPMCRAERCTLEWSRWDPDTFVVFHNGERISERISEKFFHYGDGRAQIDAIKAAFVRCHLAVTAREF